MFFLKLGLYWNNYGGMNLDHLSLLLKLQHVK